MGYIKTKFFTFFVLVPYAYKDMFSYTTNLRILYVWIEFIRFICQYIHRYVGLSIGFTTKPMHNRGSQISSKNS